MSSGRFGGGLDFGITLNAFMVRDPHEVDAVQFQNLNKL